MLNAFCIVIAGADPEKLQKENEEYTCKICLDEKIGITFVPCGHLVTCRNCSPKIKRCPLCPLYKNIAKIFAVFQFVTDVYYVKICIKENASDI